MFEVGFVGSIPNVLRRGGIFYFRRAVPVDLRRRLCKCELTRSLATADHKLAKLRSRKLYIISERVFDVVRAEPMLEDAQLAEIVKDFYETVISEENKFRLKGGAISEEQRQGRIEYHGTVIDEFQGALARNEFNSIRFTTDLLLSKQKLFGKLEEAELRQVRQAMLRAGIDIAKHLKARYEGDFNYLPSDQLLKAGLAKLTPEIPIANNPEPPSPPKKKQPKLTALSKKFMEAQVLTHAWRKQTANQAKKTYILFVEIIGDRPLAEYTREHSGKFRELIQQLPANYGKAACYRGMSIEKILEVYQRTVPADRSQLISQRTIERHFSAMSSLWKWAKPQGIVEANIFSEFKFPGAVRARNQRGMWSADDLDKLFATPIWSGCRSKKQRSYPGKIIVRDEKFWLPLIAVFTGMRLEECCQLHVEDIREQDGIPFIDINDRPPRKVKNQNAIRYVPIHEELIKIGLLSYVEKLRKEGEERLFPNLKPGGADQRFGHAFTKWFTRYRKDVALYTKGMDFHSFRHSATTILQNAEVHVPIIDELTGHASHGETSRYTKGFTLQKLKSAIDRIEIGVDLSGLYK